MKFNKHFLIIIILSELRMFVLSQFYSLMTDGKKVFRKKLCLLLNNRVFLELRVERVVLILGIKLNK